ncbi:hypothetical protein [Chromobacterium haemolyticum]|uniref:hypothetical protein n=1 Tax=Chromobacterium haemolyticum TaxID=394935 RepID=UPI002952E12D|nr:hypothetical protein [Chromobacterium haemolyticum]WON82276.1 hypothetical protein OK026_14055 [Chromobacterium haemolyticum]
MKSLLLLGLALSPLSHSAAAEPVQPDPRYSHVLSSSGPLSREQLLKTAPPAPMSRAARGDANIELMSVPGPPPIPICAAITAPATPPDPPPTTCGAWTPAAATTTA